jgi:hypothetical protein
MYGTHARNVLTIAVSGLVGYSAAAQKPVPTNIQGPFIGIMTGTAFVIALSNIPLSLATLGLSAFVAPVGVGLVYGGGYYAGKIAHHAIKNGVFDSRLA